MVIDRVTHALQRWDIWLRAVVIGASWAVGMFVVIGLRRGTSGLSTAAIYAVSGLLFGAVVALWMRRQERRSFIDADGRALTAYERVAVTEAVQGADQPGDPRLAAVAERLARHRARQPGGTGLQVALLGLVVAVTAWLAVTRSPWFWVIGVICLGFGALAILTDRQQRAAARAYLDVSAGQERQIRCKGRWGC
jgi:hypothetical protein